jgi:transcriptional regulator with XRE-family HTH domain
METTLGKRLALFRKEKGITQDWMSEKLGVTPQAVSKWENDISCPDILLLPRIAEMLDVTVDELLSHAPKKETVMLPLEKRKKLDELVFRILINSSDGDKVRINIPMPLIKMGLEIGMRLPQVTKNEALKDIDFEQLFFMVEKGVIGKLVEIEDADGDNIEILVE